MNRYKNHYVILLRPSGSQHNYKIRIMEMDKKRSTKWLSWNIHIRLNKWDKPIYAPDEEEKSQITIYKTLCIDRSKCKSNGKTKVWTNFIWKTRRTALNKCSAKWCSEIGIKRTSHCTRSDSTECTDERT